MDEKVIGGGFLITLLGWLGWQSRSINRRLNEFPEKYVMKVDYKDDVRELKSEIKGSREDHKKGLERLYDRMDSFINEGGKK